MESAPPSCMVDDNARYAQHYHQNSKECVRVFCMVHSQGIYSGMMKRMSETSTRLF
jgi:hypothetical protein